MRAKSPLFSRECALHQSSPSSSYPLTGGACVGLSAGSGRPLLCVPPQQAAPRRRTPGRFGPAPCNGGAHTRCHHRSRRRPGAGRGGRFGRGARGHRGSRVAEVGGPASVCFRAAAAAGRPQAGKGGGAQHCPSRTLSRRSRGEESASGSSSGGRWREGAGGPPAKRAARTGGRGAWCRVWAEASRDSATGGRGRRGHAAGGWGWRIRRGGGRKRQGSQERMACRAN